MLSSSSKWRLLELDENNAAMNMAIDEAILINCSKGKSPNTVRLYEWLPSAVSIGYFQNPDAEVDLEKCEKEGVDVIFAPSREEMYPQGYSTFVEIKGNLSSTLEGASRPGHFKGVATILTKLFNIINPDYSYFGKKDYQQALVVKKLVKELNLDTRILVLPTIREKDGLALSSRNSYLNKKERKAATILYKALKRAKEWVGEGEKDPSALVSKMRDSIEKEPLARIDYVAVVDPKTLEKVKEVRGEVLAFLAVNIGKTRLIDNIKLADS